MNPDGDGRPAGASVPPSAVVVNFRSADHVLACVESLLADGVQEIVVVDNASGDDCGPRLASAHPSVRFVGLDHNRGYGSAANRGLRDVSGAIVLICNPDLVIHPGAVGELNRALTDDPSLGAAGPRIDRPDGTRYPSARTFPSMIDAAGHGFIGLVSTGNPFSRRYLREGAETAGTVDWVSGACIAVRRTAFEEVRGFDESFFMFMEDVDLCWRLAAHGWKVGYVPTARVTHVEGVSRESAPYRMIVAHHWSLFRYGLRTTTGRERLWLPAVALGLALRTVLLCGRRIVTRVVPRVAPDLPSGDAA